MTTKEREYLLKTLKLSDSLYWNGILDPDLRVFDIVMMTEFGTTYNSYILKGS
jgi:flavorubredoxin